MIGLWRIILVSDLPFSDQRLNGKIPKVEVGKFSLSFGVEKNSAVYSCSVFGLCPLAFLNKRTSAHILVSVFLYCCILLQCRLLILVTDSVFGEYSSSADKPSSFPHGTVLNLGGFKISVPERPIGSP